MVILGLRQLADPVDEGERGGEVGELEVALERTVDLTPFAGQRHGLSMTAVYDRVEAMSVSRSSEPRPRDAAARTPRAHVDSARKDRPRRELLVELGFGPLARGLVVVLLPLRVAPTAVVLANTVAGLAGAVAIWRGDLVAGALLLQLKTVLDNADGQLARASGRTSTLGRYLDTEADAVVNIAVFAALGHLTGLPWLALAALVALTLVLSVDFNLEALYREARGEEFRPPPDRVDRGVMASVLAGVYRVVFGWQDAAVRSLAERRLARVLDGVADPPARRRAVLAYHDGGTVAVLVNLGLSTQLAVLGACLVLSSPSVYLVLVLGCAALMPLLWLRREHRARVAVAR